MSARRFPLLLISALVVGCATSQQGRVRLVAPEELSVAYSEIELQTSLAIAASNACVDEACARSVIFREQLRRVGERLAAAAHAVFPERSSQGLRFEFSVASRGQVGTLSNASGRIVVLDGLAGVGIDDAALAFIVAREMGHVVERHHDENSALSILVSIAVHLVMPIANLIPSSALATAGASTAASLAGSHALKEAGRPDQRDEADNVALQLLARAGWDLDAVARAVESGMQRLGSAGDEGWLADFSVSKMRLDQFDCGSVGPLGPDLLITALEAKPTVTE